MSSPCAKGTEKLHKDLREILKHKAFKNFHTVYVFKLVVSSAIEAKTNLNYGECQKISCEPAEVVIGVE